MSACQTNITTSDIRHSSMPLCNNHNTKWIWHKRHGRLFNILVKNSLNEWSTVSKRLWFMAAKTAE